MAEFIEEFLIDGRFSCAIQVDTDDLFPMRGVVSNYYDGVKTLNVRNLDDGRSVTADYRTYRFDDKVQSWAHENHFNAMPMLALIINPSAAAEVGITIGWCLFFANIDDAVAFRMRWM